MIQDPLGDSAKALLYPLWYICVLPLSVLCCLLAPLLLSSLVFSRVCACGSALPRFASPLYWLVWFAGSIVTKDSEMLFA